MPDKRTDFDSLRILMLVFNQTGRGTYWRAFFLARELVQHGHRVTLIATSPSSQRNISTCWSDGVEIVETPDLLKGSLRSGWDPWNTYKRYKWIGKQSFDIVHAFESRPTVLYPALFAQSRGARLIMDWCDWFGKGGSLEERPNPIVRAILRPIETNFELSYRARVNGATAINHFLKSWLHQLGVPLDKILLLRNGSDLSREVLNLEQARRLCDLPADGKLIGFVGGTYPCDARFMAEAFNRVKAELPQSKLILAGSFNRDIRAHLNEKDAVIETGPTSLERIFHFISSCNICWLPMCDTGANRGRLPLKLNDYMSAGRPIVSTAVGDLPELIQTYEMGVVTPDDPRQFALASIALLGNETRMQSMGVHARQAAENELNWSALSKQLLHFYIKILQDETGA